MSIQRNGNNGDITLVFFLRHCKVKINIQHGKVFKIRQKSPIYGGWGYLGGSVGGFGVGGGGGGGGGVGCLVFKVIVLF